MSVIYPGFYFYYSSTTDPKPQNDVQVSLNEGWRKARETFNKHLLSEWQWPKLKDTK